MSDDILKAAVYLSGTIASVNQYDPIDRYRDFQKVFGTVEGQRVLGQIAVWGRVLSSTYDENSNLANFKNGERNLALKILSGLTPPPGKETTQRRKK